MKMMGAPMRDCRLTLFSGYSEGRAGDGRFSQNIVRALDHKRFLAQFWFPTSIKSLHATAIVQSPAWFRRRGIVVDETEYQRC